MFAMSVSPLTRALLEKIEAGLEIRLSPPRTTRTRTAQARDAESGERGEKKREPRQTQKKPKANENSVEFGGEVFEIEKLKGKKYLVLPLEKLVRALKAEPTEATRSRISGFKGKVLVGGKTLLHGEKTDLIIKLAESIPLMPIDESNWNRKLNLQPTKDAKQQAALIDALDWTLRVAAAKLTGNEAGFICLYTDSKGNYWFKVSRGFSTALNESLSSLETLIDEMAGGFTDAQKEKANEVYRKLQNLYE
jgi:hypothetical protein